MKTRVFYIAQRFLRWYCADDRIDEVEGDLIELFDLRCSTSPQMSSWHFAWDVLRSLRSVNLKQFNMQMMSRNLIELVFKSGYRQMLRNKLYTGINMVGLIIGFCVAALIGLFVHTEWSYDKFHTKYEQVYRILKTDSLFTEQWAYNPPAVAPSLVDDFPEVVSQCRIYNYDGAQVSRGDEELSMTKGLAVDSTFFDLFDFQVIYGSKDALLKGKHEIVISRKLANTYFKDIDPLGVSLSIGSTEFLVSGVLDVPANSHLQFDFLIPLSARFNSTQLGIWRQSFLYSYVLVESTSVEELNTKIMGQLEKYELSNKGQVIALQPLGEIHLNPTIFGEMEVRGNGLYVELFAIFGLVLIIIACINFMNLTLGRVTERLKNIGVRRVVGANRGLVFLQLYVEALFVVAGALVVSLIGALFFLPMFNALTGGNATVVSVLKILPVGYWIAGMSMVLLITTFLSCAYPALVLSGIKPLTLLSGSLGKPAGNRAFSKGLGIIQFGISLVLLLSAIVVNKQLDYIMDKPLGWDKNNLVSINLKHGMMENYDTFKSALQNESTIESITWTSELPIDVRVGGQISFEGMNPEKTYVSYYMNGDEDFYKTFRLKEHNDYPIPTSPPEHQKNYVINESLLSMLREEWGSEVSPIGKELDGGKIVGVVQDYHWQPLQHKIGPILYGIAADDEYGSPTEIAIRIKDGQLKSGIESIKKSFIQVYPDRGMDFKFVDEQIASIYAAEQNSSTLLKIFSSLAIIISCLGLFGLAYQSINLRLKEMCVRKVLGASFLSLFYRLVVEFGVVFILSVLLAVPISLLTTGQWMDAFAYRTDINWMLFAFAVVSFGLIVMLTLGLNLWKLNRLNPAIILRDD